MISTLHQACLCSGFVTHRRAAGADLGGELFGLVTREQQGSCFLFRIHITPHMNKRLIAVGIALGVVILVAFLMGSPMFGGFDTMR